MHIGNLENITPTVNFASRATAPPGTDWGARIIPDFQLFYVLSGQAELRVGQHQVKYIIRAGECVHYGPGCTHQLTTVEATEYFSIHFHWDHPSPSPVHPGYSIQHVVPPVFLGEPLAPTIEVLPYGHVLIPSSLSPTSLEPILSKMVKEYEWEQPGYALVLRGLMMQAIAIIIRHLIGSLPRLQRYDKIDPAIQAMQESPGKNWSVSELAGLCGYHPIHFAKLFKEEVGAPPKQYIINERIKQAKRALLQGEKLDTISQTLGFTSLHYFSHQFKKVTGLTPTEFRLNGKE